MSIRRLRVSSAKAGADHQLPGTPRHRFCYGANFPIFKQSRALPRILSRTRRHLTTVTSAGRLRSAWDRLANLPFGRRMFSVFLGRMAPYTGSIRPMILEMRDGYARVGMDDRRPIRNHLSSVHAVALANLGEVASGLALHYALPNHARAILTNLSIEFLKKGRGYLEAEATAPTPTGNVREDLTLHTTIRDLSGDVVARVTARWLVGPREEPVSPQ